MSVAVIDSGGANIGSVMFALQRLGVSGELTRDHGCIRSASRVILPGVGAAADAMTRLRDYGLDELIPTLTQPVLGICLGMQLLFEHSDEGDVECLGVLPGKVERMSAAENLPVPHMGWNTVAPLGELPLLAGVENQYFYFVHGYAVTGSASAMATSEYGTRFVSVAARDNFFATQFHPERSGAPGARLLANFLGE
ncbi:MAG: imidazole glycerol phosphate synthase subunit HisH [Chromatiales bacterium]|nr:imidazole glycerol phosphate synthase subunit HisH [Chromatiales bacterium]